jgi:hypothetical protein
MRCSTSRVSHGRGPVRLMGLPARPPIGRLPDKLRPVFYGCPRNQGLGPRVTARCGDLLFPKRLFEPLATSLLFQNIDLQIDVRFLARIETA